MSRAVNKKVVVAMSGGVDSSVATALLKEQGLEVIGAHMRCWEDCDTAKNDTEDARKIASVLGIPFYVLDFKKEYKERVFQYMIREYMNGRTPNPDVMCNKEIKFGLLLQKALAMGAEYVATGHYVRQAGYKLKIAVDTVKDQSYFLWTLTQNQLRHALFPIGDYTKAEVRELAKKFGLSTASKKDSQGLCFVGKVDFNEFLKNYIEPHTGNIIDSDGKKLGEHPGAFYYTVGQRHGLGVGGGDPYYVVEKNVDTNTLVVGRTNDSLLYKKEVEISDVNWVGEAPREGGEYLARIRYRQPLQRCRVERNKRQETRYKMMFENPQRAVASGQALVLYDGDIMLGGGVII